MVLTLKIIYVTPYDALNICRYYDLLQIHIRNTYIVREYFSMSTLFPAN